MEVAIWQLINLRTYMLEIIINSPILLFYFKMAAATVAETALQDRQDTATSPLAPLGDDDLDDEDGIQGRDAGLLSF